MKILRFLIALLLIYTLCTFDTKGQIDEKFNPPATQRITVTDNYFGMKVTDPYRWLENVKDSNVLQWLQAQSDYAKSWLDKIPGRDSLVAEFARLDAMKPATISGGLEGIVAKGNRYFFRKTLSEDKTGKLYCREGKNGGDLLLYDPGFDKDSIPFSISTFVPSEDGSKVALLISKSGAETGHIRILDVASKKLLADDVFPCREYVSWLPDGKGILYLSFQSGDNHSQNAELNTKTMYHALGTGASGDKEIFSMRKYPNLGILPSDWCVVKFTKDFKHLIAYCYSVDNNIECFYAPAGDLLMPAINWKPLLTRKDEVSDLIMDGNDVYMLSHQNAPGSKILHSNLTSFSVAQAREVVAEDSIPLFMFNRTKDFLLLSYYDGISSILKQYNVHTGQLSSIKIPVPGNAALIPFGIQTNDAIMLLTSRKQPVTLYDYNADSKTAQESPFNIKAAYPGVEDIILIET